MDNKIIEEKIKLLGDIIRDSDNIVFFGGAGVSTESNIPDFRSAEGIFNKKLNKRFSPEELVSIECFLNYPEDFFDFYKDRLIYPKAEPNNAHKALAKLEEMGKLTSVITQNIDGLHQKAGSKRVHELHGTLLKNYCTKCKKFFDLDTVIELIDKNKIPLCDDCNGIIKPDVVLYGESLNQFTIREAIKDISNADTLIIGGTSLVVYPAAQFIDYFRGENLVIINMSTTSRDNQAKLCINAPIGEVMGEIVDLI